MISSVKIFARIGELIQGILPDGSEFLVSGLSSGTFYSKATLEEGGKATELPLKAAKALNLFPQAASLPIRLHSNIPPGKGLSSSSTDVLSVLSLVNGYLGAGMGSEELYRLAAQIEPTDPCLSTDIVLFRQRSGITMSEISLPPLSLLYFDAAPDRQVDTLDLQRVYPTDASWFFDGLLRRFLQAVAEKDYSGLLDCVTTSAVYNQAILALPRFDEYYRLAADSQAGLMVAHSGTIIGLLTRPEQAHPLRQKLERMANHYHPAPVYLENYFSPSTNVYV